MRTNILIHSMHCHMRETLVILEVSNRPQPCCLACEMFIPWAALKLCHPMTALYAKGVESNISRLVEDES